MTTQEERVASVIEAYDAQGWHRTGTELDLLSARWLATLVQQQGVESVLEPFSFIRVDPLTNYIEVDGEQLTGLLLFDGAFTDTEGVEGKLGRIGSGSAIGLAEVGPLANQPDLFEAERRTASHQVIVAVTLGAVPGLVARNAAAFTAPFGPPVLQIGSEARALLMQHAERGSVARAVVAAERTEAQAFNVVALLKGRNPQLAPLIITTPRSGWWHCACERGGGLVCWLECMRLLSESSHDRDVLFAAFSGHELGFIGVDGFTATRPALEQGAFMWLHFGASIGPSRSLFSSSVVPASLRFSAPDEDIAGLVRESMASERITEVSAAPPGMAIGGESVVVHQRGGKVIALLGSSPLFHLEADRWPVAVDVGAVADIARASSRLALMLANRS